MLSGDIYSSLELYQTSVTTESISNPFTGSTSYDLYMLVVINLIIQYIQINQCLKWLKTWNKKTKIIFNNNIEQNSIQIKWGSNRVSRPQWVARHMILSLRFKSNWKLNVSLFETVLHNLCNAKYSSFFVFVLCPHPLIEFVSTIWLSCNSFCHRRRRHGMSLVFCFV